MSAAVARFTWLGFVLVSCACKQPAPAPIAHPPARVESVAPATTDAIAPGQRPVRDPFELEDEPEDPAAALEAMRHNCCDEMPADEIRERSGAAKAPPKRP